MSPFEVNILSPKRTICEKIMSLVRFSHTDKPIYDLRNKIRHIYDIHFLLKDNSVNAFFLSSDFDKMMRKVGNDDIISFKSNNDWLKIHPASALIFEQTVEIWEQLKNTYNGAFSELVYGELPKENEILETLKIVSQRLQNIKWKIE